MDAELGDFTTTPRVVPIALLAIFIGVLGALLAVALLSLINLFTRLFFFQRWSFEPASPADNQLGLLQVAVPVLGALIIGVMARYGSERIRGHGIPEALESILTRGSRVEPRVALLKPGVVGDFDRVGRTFRRRGSDHHDRWRGGVDRRSVVSLQRG